MLSPWSELSLLESHDVLRDKYHDRHGRELSAGKANEIVAFFSQGRQYFEAAAVAGSLVRPLLLYYGVNALTRGAILYLQPTLRQTSLKPSHGLEIFEWQKTLADGIKSVGQLKLTVGTSGTFPEFVAATGNVGSVPVTTEDYKFDAVEIGGTASIDTPQQVSVLEILSRMPGVFELFPDVVGAAPDVSSVGIKQSADRTRTILDVYGWPGFPPDESKLHAQIPHLAPLKGEFITEEMDKRELLRFRLTHAAPAPVGALPPLRYVGGLTLLVGPFSAGLDLSPASVLYLFAYALGMMARYFPQHWLTLQAGARGDRLYPLIREGLQHLERSFPINLADAMRL